VLHVKGPNDFERVSGSSIGGGTIYMTMWRESEQNLIICLIAL